MVTYLRKGSVMAGNWTHDRKLQVQHHDDTIVNWLLWLLQYAAGLYNSADNCSTLWVIFHAN